MNQTSKDEYSFSKLQKEGEMINSVWNEKRVSKYFIEETILEPRLGGHQNLPLVKEKRG